MLGVTSGANGSPRCLIGPLVTPDKMTLANCASVQFLLTALRVASKPDIPRAARNDVFASQPKAQAFALLTSDVRNASAFALRVKHSLTSTRPTNKWFQHTFSAGVVAFCGDNVSHELSLSFEDVAGHFLRRPPLEQRSCRATEPSFPDAIHDRRIRTSRRAAAAFSLGRQPEESVTRGKHPQSGDRNAARHWSSFNRALPLLRSSQMREVTNPWLTPGAECWSRSAACRNDAVVGIAVIGIAVVGIAVVGIAVIGIAVVGIAVVGIAVVGIAVVGIAVTGIAVTGSLNR
jgi:hypothetical protein